MKANDLLSYESARMNAFKLIIACYVLPDQLLSKKLENLELYMKNVCEPAVGFIRRMRKEIENGADLEPLQVDFSKLFIGPYKIFAAPYGSVYLEDGRKVMGDSTLDVKNRYLEAGLEMAKEFKDAPDHITAEIEFMYYLIFKEIQSFSNSDTEAAIGFLQKQKSFLEHHLMAWVPKFASNMIEHAETIFYRNLARATKTFLKENYQAVCSILDGEELNFHYQEREKREKLGAN